MDIRFIELFYGREAKLLDEYSHPLKVVHPSTNEQPYLKVLELKVEKKQIVIQVELLPPKILTIKDL